MANLYTKQENGKRSFSGEINPMNQDDKLSLIDIYNVNEIQQKTTPKGINKYLFKIMTEATNSENDLFKL